jgi:hypothetical protein
MTEFDARSINNHTPSKVPDYVCREWRRTVHDGTHPTHVDKRTYCLHTVRKHLTGACNHEHTGEPLAFVAGEWVSDSYKRSNDAYERNDAGWRYECRECEQRQLVVRRDWLWCRECCRRFRRCRDLKTESLVGLGAVKE